MAKNRSQGSSLSEGKELSGDENEYNLFYGK